MEHRAIMFLLIQYIVITISYIHTCIYLSLIQVVELIYRKSLLLFVSTNTVKLLIANMDDYTRTGTGTLQEVTKMIYNYRTHTHTLRLNTQEIGCE